MQAHPSQQQQTFHRDSGQKLSFERAHSSVGISTGPLLHLTRIGTALAPLIVLEAVKEPLRQSRWIRICALVGAAASETIWAVREHQRREERRFEHYR